MFRTRALVGALALAAAASFGGNAEASCYFTGKVLYAYSYANGSNDYAYYYITPTTSGVPSYVRYVYVSNGDDHAAELLSAALGDGNTVSVSGSAGSCSTSGTYRYAGQLNYVYAYTQQ